MIQIINPLILGIGILQIVAGLYGFWIDTPKVGAISVLVGVANLVMATMKA